MSQALRARKRRPAAGAMARRPFWIRSVKLIARDEASSLASVPLRGLGPALFLSVVLISGALLRATSLHDAITGAPVPDAHLHPPAWSMLLAPFCNVADAITTLPLQAHYAFMAVVVAVGITWPVRSASSPRPLGSLRSVALRAVRGIACVLGAYVVAVVVPRPVARLVMADPDAVVVDFHSHTNASHDGRRSFSVQANREWHARVGFDVAYITDHGTVTDRVPSIDNPRRAGDGTVLLPGVEIRRDGRHLNMLGALPADSSHYTRAVRDDAAPPRGLAHDNPRVALLTIPTDLDRNGVTRGVQAIELSDASPRGLDQEDRDRSSLIALADRNDLALVAGSNNHGWAANAAAWSVLRIPGWRAMTPDELDQAIQHTIVTQRRRAVQVVEIRPILGSAFRESFASAIGDLPLRAWMLCRTLSSTERAAWLVWVWIPWLLRLALAWSPAALARRSQNARSQTEPAAKAVA